MNKKLSLFSEGVNPRKLNLIKEYINGASSLDIACGNGLYGLELARRSQRVIQVDIADRRHKDAKNIPFAEMDVQKLGFDDNEFDNAIAFDIMEHLVDDELFCQELHRICKGIILLSVPHADDSKLKSVGVTHKHHIDKTHQREYSVDSLLNLFEKNNFQVIDLIYQHNQGIINFASVFEKNNVISKISSRIIYYQIKSLIKLKIFQNTIVSDLFAVIKPIK